MKFEYIKLVEGMFQRTIEFSENNNLIFSNENSQGKTTLLRLMMYSLGYKIPNTKSIKFADCYVEAGVTINDRSHRLVRNGDHIEVTTDTSKQEFILQEEQDKLHIFLFGIDNYDILHNLLGCFYVDQEKGWTLLNRGTVIGSNRFNVEELLRGFANRDCQELNREIRKIEHELSKYKKMLNIAEYRQQVFQEQGALIYESYDENLEKELDNLRIQKGVLEKELKEVRDTYTENQGFKKYIEKMRISVVNEDGIEIPVNAKTIKNFNDINELLKARLRIIAAEISSIERRIQALDRIVEDNQLSFATTESILSQFDKKITAIDINQKTVKKIIDALETRKHALVTERTLRTKQNNEHLLSMYANIEKYAKELSLEKYINLRTDFVFTHNLKELSGAILHKIVFAFKLGFIIEAEKYLGYKLPIILDSPSGKEVDPSNVEKMIDILNRDFKDNQIIIASIHKYPNWTTPKIHTINGQLIDEQIQTT